MKKPGLATGSTVESERTIFSMEGGQQAASRLLRRGVTGVICASDNYAAQAPLSEGVLRVTVLANHDCWSALGEDAYAAEKERCADLALDAAARFAPDPRPHRVLHDVATPRTIRRYTGKLGGAVYGCPEKRLGGESGVEGLHLVGTDQGLLGVVGALLSGITVANREGLIPSGTT